MNTNTKKFYAEVEAAIGEAASLARKATSTLTPQSVEPGKYGQLVTAVSDMIGEWEAWLELSSKTTAELEAEAKANRS